MILSVIIMLWDYLKSFLVNIGPGCGSVGWKVTRSNSIAGILIIPLFGWRGLRTSVILESDLSGIIVIDGVFQIKLDLGEQPD